MATNELTFAPCAVACITTYEGPAGRSECVSFTTMHPPPARFKRSKTVKYKVHYCRMDETH
jgi:hypothetical protein